MGKPSPVVSESRHRRGCTVGPRSTTRNSRSPATPGRKASAVTDDPPQSRSLPNRREIERGRRPKGSLRLIPDVIRHILRTAPDSVATILEYPEGFLVRYNT